MVLTAVLAAGAVVSVLLVMTKKAGAPVSAVLGMAMAAAAVAVAASRADAGAFPAWWLPVPWLVSVLGVPLALADARHRRLPDVLTLPAYPAVALTITLAAFSGGGWRLAAGAVLGCLLFGGTHLIVHRLSAGGLGAGDVKLAGSFGAVLGAVGGLAPAVAAVLAAVVSMVAVVPMWLMRRVRAGLPSLEPAPRATGFGVATPKPGTDSTEPVALLRRSGADGEIRGLAPSLPQSATPADVARVSALADPAFARKAAAPESADLAAASTSPAPAPTGPVPGSTGLVPGTADLVPEPVDSAPASTGPVLASTGSAPESGDLAPAPTASTTVVPARPGPAPAPTASTTIVPARPCPAPESGDLTPEPTASTAAAPASPGPAAESPPAGPARPGPAPASPPPVPAPPSAPARSRIRAGPLRVPYGPGLVLATWACAVFPAAGTGIA
ncbi:prepilin peptidase [Amycolatopsis sp. NPDC054798]